MKKITITLILASSMGFATDISGTVSGTWDIDGSPYFVVGNTTVSSGATLTIEPGVEVIFSGSYTLTVNDGSSMISNGTSENEIYFHGEDNTEQGNIIFSSAGGAVFSHCRIENLYVENFSDDFNSGFNDDWWDAGGGQNANVSNNQLQLIGVNSSAWAETENITVSDICIISLDFRVAYSEDNCRTYFYWNLNGGDWITLYNTSSDQEYPWTHIEWDISEYVSAGDQIQLRLVSQISSSSDNSDQQYSYFDNVLICPPGAISATGAVTLYNSQVSDSRRGINAAGDVTLTSSHVTDNSEIGVNAAGDVTLTSSHVTDNSDGIVAAGDVTLLQSFVNNNESTGITTNGALTLDYVVVAYNGDKGIEITGNDFSTLDNSILWHNDNDDHQQISLSNGIVNTNYSNVQGVSSFGVTGDGQFVWGAGCIESNPVFTDSSGTLSANSPCVDAAAPWQHDANMPPGLGTIVADMGAYGGPNNTVWGGTAIPDGEPIIDHIVDLPADQGGTVGIQYSASIFDYGHTGYDITSYSFWRELDVGRSGVRSQISAFPQGPYFVTSRDNYWEQIGTMDAQGFENYGYSAATLADSSADGIFWSKHLVVAHTPDDNIFFVSDPDSGYSVDNIPPTPPNVLSGTFDDGTLTASWEDEINPDILHYDVYRNGSSFLETAEPEFTDDTFDLGDSAVFTIRGVDIHDNTGEFSDPFTATYGTKGDVTWDGIINILDVTKILYIILFPDEEVTDEEFWAGNYNSDEGIDVVDVTPVVDIILGGLLSNMENSGGETMVYLQDNTLMLTSYRPITGIQVLLSDNTTVSNLTSLSMAAEANKVLVYTLTGDVLQGVDIPVLTLGSDAVIEDIILVDNLGQRVSSVLEIVEEDLIPDEFAVHQNYPNPFNPSTLIKLDVNKPMHSKVSIYDLMGRELNVLVDEKLQPGYHQFIWDGTDSKGIKAGSGLYFILVQTPEVTRTMKATLLR